MGNFTDTQYLTSKSVSKVLGVSVSTVWRWARLDIIPKPIKIGLRSTRWRLSDIQAYLERESEVL